MVKGEVKSGSVNQVKLRIEDSENRNMVSNGSTVRDKYVME